MEYINHIGKYTDSQAVADALEAGTLASPYVVQIDGSNYYDNYPEPDACANWEEGGYESYEDCRCQQYGEDCPEQTMGYWSDDGEGNYTFQITEFDEEDWQEIQYWNDVQIAELYGVHYDGGTTDMSVKLSRNINGFWTVDFTDGGSDYPTSDDLFQDNEEPVIWDNMGVATGGQSDDGIRVAWNGHDTLTFGVSPNGTPLNIGTIDPPYPSEEEPGE